MMAITTSISGGLDYVPLHSMPVCKRSLEFYEHKPRRRPALEVWNVTNEAMDVLRALKELRKTSFAFKESYRTKMLPLIWYKERYTDYSGYPFTYINTRSLKLYGFLLHIPKRNHKDAFFQRIT